MATKTITAQLLPEVVGADADLAGGTINTTAEIAATIRIVDPEYYEGETTFTPSASAQVIPTRNLVMTEDITIEPIPSNYGKITWNGSYLTVS